MNMRILHLYEPTPESPFVSAQAAANHWLAPVLRSQGLEVVARPAILSDGATLSELAAHFDAVHTFGRTLEAPAVPVPTVQTVFDRRPVVGRGVALSWVQARTWQLPPLSVAPAAIDTGEVDPPPYRGDHLATVYHPGEERQLHDAVAVAHATERELVVLAHPHAEVPALDSRLARVAPVPATAPPAELLSAAAYVSFTFAPADVAAVTAMAAGTPVITLDGLAAAETVVSGESGFVCYSVDEAARAVDRLDLLRPHLGRERARLLFDTETAARHLAEVYAALASGERRHFRHPELLAAAS